MFDKYPDIVTPEDLENMLRIGRNKSYEYLESGIIKGFRIGRIWRISKQAVIDYIVDASNPKVPTVEVVAPETPKRNKAKKGINPVMFKS